MVCHTGGPHFSKGVPIFPGVWGSRVPILSGKWGPGSPYSREYRDPGPHFPGSMGRSFTRFPGDLKPPMDTYLHASRREVNQNPVIKPGVKQGLVVMFWAPKIASEAISQHQIQKKFPGGACPQTPRFCVHTKVDTRVFVRKADQCYAFAPSL